MDNKIEVIETMVNENEVIETTASSEKNGIMMAAGIVALAVLGGIGVYKMVTKIIKDRKAKNEEKVQLSQTDSDGIRIIELKDDEYEVINEKEKTTKEKPNKK